MNRRMHRVPWRYCWLLLISVGGAACHRTPPTLDQLSQALENGQLEATCTALEAELDRPGTPARRLRVVRLFVECRMRQGASNEAQSVIARLAPPPLAIYGAALLTVALDPKGLHRALQELGRAQAGWPHVGEIPYRAGVLLMADHAPAQALAWFERAAGTEDSAAIQVARAHALLDLGGCDEALAAAARAVTLQPTPTDVARGKLIAGRIQRRLYRADGELGDQLARIRAQMERPGELGSAVTALERVSLERPHVGQVQLLLGLAELRLGSEAAATVALREACALMPLSPLPPLLLARIAASHKRTDEALAQLRLAAARDPFKAEIATMLGRMLMDGGQPKEAAKWLGVAARLERQDLDALRRAAQAHLAAQEPDQAFALYSTLRDRAPNDFEISLRLAQLLLRRTERSSAPSPIDDDKLRRYAAEAAKARPDDPEARELLLRLEQREHSRPGH